jgi:hypothetical protein
MIIFDNPENLQEISKHPASFGSLISFIALTFYYLVNHPKNPI